MDPRKERIAADLAALRAIYRAEWQDRLCGLARVGVPVALDRREEVRAAWSAAVERMEDLLVELDAVPADGDSEVRSVLEQRFADAEAEANRHKLNLDRLERIAAARADFLPGDDGEPSGDESGAEEREHQLTQPRAAAGTPAAGSVRHIATLSTPRVAVTREPLTYERTGRNGNSYFRDVMRVSLGHDPSAVARLQRHAREMNVEARAFVNSTDGTGGDFVPPLWMMEEWTNVIRMGRQFANAVAQRPLPGGTDTISIPRLLTGTAVAAQTDEGAVIETVPTTGSFSVGVKTIAGQATVTRQLLDRAQPGIDEILFADLAADYALRIDLQALTGSGAGANAKGVFSDANRIQVTYTSGSPTVAGLYSKVADAVQQITTQRGLPPNLIVMAPRRWAWATAQSDASGRPLVTPAAGGGQGQLTLGAGNEVTNFGAIGYFYGLPVIVDGNIPTNFGAGTNEDAIVVLRTADVWLMEDAPVKTRVDESVRSPNLEVLLQLWNYFAFTTERYSKAVATIGGTGLATPTF